MEKNHYTSHNQKMLESIMGKTHRAWLLKRAKRTAKPALGKTFSSLRALKSLKNSG